MNRTDSPVQRLLYEQTVSVFSSSSLGMFLSFPVNITCLIVPVVYGAPVYCSLGFCAKTHISEKLKCPLRYFFSFFYTCMKLLPLKVNRTG